MKILNTLTPKRLGSALLMMTLPLLSGCSIMGVYEGNFDCPAGKVVGCRSISDVNDMVNQGTLPPTASPNDPEDNPEGYPEGNSVYSEHELNISHDDSYQHSYGSNDDSLNHPTNSCPSNSEHRHGAQGSCGRCAVRTPSAWQEEIWWADALEERDIPLWVEDEVGA